MPMRLSFGMIARNEERNILRCLDSVAAISDEIFVVDTGSTDSTVALAQSRGARVVPFLWIDDFSAAYNAMLDQVSGDWVFCLDADEWLLPDSQALLRNLIESPEAMAYFVQRQEMEQPDQTEGFVEMRQMRLCRNDPSLRTVGKDHPHFGTLLEERAERTGRKILDSAIRIRHSGYLPEKKPIKLQRAAHLLQKELEEHPGQLFYEIELGRTWEMLGDPRGPALIEEILERLLTRSRAVKPPSLLAMTVLERSLRRDDPHSPRTMKVLKLAARWFPNSPPLLEASAAVHYHRGEFARAIPLLQRLIEVAEMGSYDRVLAFSSHFLGEDAYLNLAVCYHRLAKLDEAERWYRRLLALNPQHQGASQNLRLLQEHRQSLS